MKPTVSKGQLGCGGLTVVRVLVLAASFFLQHFCAGQYVGPLSAIVTDFTKGPSLSEPDIKIVVKLAQKAGVPNVAKSILTTSIPHRWCKLKSSAQKQLMVERSRFLRLML